MEKISVAVVGAAGYAGGELLRILSMHPAVKLTCLCSSSYCGKDVRQAFPGMRGSFPAFEEYDPERVCRAADVIFLAQESGFALCAAPELLRAGRKVVDLSADFRLKDASLYSSWYKIEPGDQATRDSAVYGLPERNREVIRSAALIANPGCYPTAALLGLLPLVETGLVDPQSIIVDAKSGVSGAGRSKHTLVYHYPELNESLQAYAAGGVHRHTPEIEAVLRETCGAEAVITFTPHLVPMTRGILATIYARPVAGACLDDLHGLYKARYQGHPAVLILEAGKLPSTKAVCGTNECHISPLTDKRSGRVIVFSAIDNLIKGAAGQAVQNMNLMCGFHEFSGLEWAGIWP